MTTAKEAIVATLATSLQSAISHPTFGHYDITAQSVYAPTPHCSRTALLPN